MTTIDDPTRLSADPDLILAGLLPPDARSVVIADGEELCREGDPSDQWWYIDEGWADVTAEGIFLGNQTILWTELGQVHTFALLLETSLQLVHPSGWRSWDFAPFTAYFIKQIHVPGHHALFRT